MASAFDDGSRRKPADKPTPPPWRIEATRGSEVAIISAGMNAHGDGPDRYVMQGRMSRPDAELAIAAHDLLAACQAAEAADLHLGNCRDCVGPGECPEYVRLIDHAAVLRGKALEKVVPL